MIAKHKFLIICFILLAFIISLFPPFSWGNRLPFKQHDFLFNDIQKEFVIDGSTIIKERHIIFGELVIEFILAFLLSIMLEMLYKKFSSKTLFLLIYLLTLFIVFVVYSYSFTPIAKIFQPSYQEVKQTEDSIKAKYSRYYTRDDIYSFDDLTTNIFEIKQIINGLKELDWFTTEGFAYKFWLKIRESIDLTKNELPKIGNYIIPIKTEPSNKNSIKKGFSSFMDSYFEKEEKRNRSYKISLIQKLYGKTDFKYGYTIDYARLEKDINKAKFKKEFDNYPDYINIKKNYFSTFREYWHNSVPKMRFIIGILLFAIVSSTFYFFRKTISLKLKSYVGHLDSSLQ